MVRFILVFIALLFSCYAPTPVTTTPTTTPTPIFDEIGTECSKDVSNLWLDVAVVIDRSLSMGEGVSNIASLLEALFYNLIIGQSGPHHYIRVGIILFDSNATIFSDITKYNSTQDLIDDLGNLLDYPIGTNPEVNIQNALQTAYYMLESNNRNARKVVLLFTSTYDGSGIDDPMRVADSLKQMNYFIIGVDYDDAGNIATDLLRNISSPGMFYYASDLNVVTTLTNAFCYANCFCPPYTQQLFVITNQTTGSGKYYADCIFGSSTGAFWIFAELACAKQNGTLVTFTSQTKENFVLTKILPLYIQGANYFHIGLHRNNITGQMSWLNYDGNDFPLGNYINWAPGFPTALGDCVFIDNLGPAWGWETEPCAGGNQWSYVCQTQACDAVHDCPVPTFIEIPK